MRKLICYKRYEIVLSPKVDCFIISMQNIADFLNSAIKNYHIDSSAIQNVQGCLRKEMKVDGWILLILSNRERVVLRFENGVFMNEGFVVNDEKVLKVYGNHQTGHISYSEEQKNRVPITYSVKAITRSVYPYLLTHLFTIDSLLSRE